MSRCHHSLETVPDHVVDIQLSLYLVAMERASVTPLRSGPPAEGPRCSMLHQVSGHLVLAT
eukprot:scaffold74024_cov36-Tisochrysis_lutea.AAC.1